MGFEVASKCLKPTSTSKDVLRFQLESPKRVDKACGYLHGTVVPDSCSSHVLLGEKSKFTQTALLLCMLGSSQQ